MEFTVNVESSGTTVDGVTVKVQTAVSCRGSLLDSVRRRGAVARVARSTLRLVVGKLDLDAVLHDDFAPAVLAAVPPVPGVVLESVAITSVRVPEWIEESLATVAVAERERRAALIRSETEFQASARLTEAAAVLKVPAGYLRWLVTLERIGRAEVDIEARGPSTVPVPKPEPKPSVVDERLKAGLRAVQKQRRGEEWMGDLVG
ncbi:MAG TPA: SPFH domain-containing protein [Candidatus Eisenbacteria bacterium]|nr:SPFH domain-containing protein [Candidatus Eisenbacteria bacterium]